VDNKRLARPGNLLFNHDRNLLSELFCSKNQSGVGAVTNLGYDIQIQKLTHQTTVGLLPRHGVITQREVNSVWLPQPNSNAEAMCSITRPSKDTRVAHHACTNRIEFNVSQAGQEIFIFAHLA